MKLRTLIFGALLLVSVLPVGILAYWQQQTAISNEFSIVENQHKVIARNLTIALERYATDLRSAFLLTTENLQTVGKINGLEWHLGELFFQHVCAIDSDGKIQKLQCALTCPSRICYPSISKINKGRGGEFQCSQAIKDRDLLGMVDFPLAPYIELGFHRFKLLRARPDSLTGF